jgi:serine/threonine protein kinase
MPDTRYCPKCGEACGVEDRFCTNCRTELRSAPSRPGGGSRPGGTATEPRDTPNAYSTEMGLPVNAVLLDRYKILKLLGAGGMGRVYLAEDQKLSMPVAIKVLRDILTQDPVSVKRLITEAKTSILLAHPNILRLHNFEDGETAKFLVMEYVEGESLADKIAREGKLSEEETRSIAIEVCKGLEHAHLKKVIHRDMKPGNVMLGKDGSVKIADFGLARLCHDSIARMTSQLSTGTLQYMSPEQLDGEIGESSDLYALGITLYEMLAGDPPFVTGEITAQIRNKVPKPIEGVSPELNDIVLKCLEKKKENRFASIRELREELDGTAALRKQTSRPGEQAGSAEAESSTHDLIFTKPTPESKQAAVREASARTPQLAVLKSKGTEAYNAGRYGEAIAAWQEAQALNPGDADLHESLATARKQADLVVKEAESRKVEEARKQWLDDTIDRVNALFQQGTYREAETILQQALQHFPNHATLMQQLGLVRERLRPAPELVKHESKPKSRKKILVWTLAGVGILVILGVIGNLMDSGQGVTGTWNYNVSTAPNINVNGQMQITGTNEQLQIISVASYRALGYDGLLHQFNEQFTFEGKLNGHGIVAVSTNGSVTMDGMQTPPNVPIQLNLTVSEDWSSMEGQVQNPLGIGRIVAHKH